MKLLCEEEIVANTLMNLNQPVQEPEQYSTHCYMQFKVSSGALKQIIMFI